MPQNAVKMRLDEGIKIFPALVIVSYVSRVSLDVMSELHERFGVSAVIYQAKN